MHPVSFLLTSMFSRTLAFLVDFGMVITPLCRDQRISTCAGVLPSLFAISTTGGLSKMAPLANGQYPWLVEHSVARQTRDRGCSIGISYIIT